jgi:catechol 2,3-dioxygenase-like lactoylglutathione lyase family enzyme
MAPQISALDHAALLVKDLDVSVKWYQDVLGLKPSRVKEWGPFPVFMLTKNDSGLALFPSEIGNPLKANTKTPHFAFRVDKKEFLEFQSHLKTIGINFTFQDHLVDHSIYFRDPDDYLIEIIVHL